MKTVFEALTNDDIEVLSDMELTEDEVSKTLSLFELIPEENKDKAFDLVKVLFKSFKEDKEEETKAEETVEKKEEVNSKEGCSTDVTKKKKANVVSERYTKTLLGD